MPFDPLYVPDRGDVVWIDFDPQIGHEQASRRPALVLSPNDYNKKTGLTVVCPITNKIKGYPFEVVIPGGFKVGGVILSDQVKSLDWKGRRAEYLCDLPASVLDDVVDKILALID